MDQILRWHLDKWSHWSETADHSTDGWESNYTDWNELIEHAVLAMENYDSSPEILKDIEKCWSLSEETEELLEHTKNNLTKYWPILLRLATSDDPRVRWQVYSALEAGGSRAETILRNGLCDPDAYCRRRAILALAHIGPADSKQICDRLISDNDPYIRQAALEMALASSDQTYIHKICAQLLGDNVEHVREAARFMLNRLH